MSRVDDGMTPVEQRIDSLMEEMTAAADSIEWDLNGADLRSMVAPRHGRVTREQIAVGLLAAAVLVLLFAPIPRLHLFGSSGTRVTPGAYPTTTTGLTKQCTAGGLALTTYSFGAASTSNFFVLQVRNESSSPNATCTITGKPRLTAGATPIPTRWSSLIDGIHFSPSRSVVLTPGAGAWFDVFFDRGACEGKACANVTGLGLVLPYDRGTVRVPAGDVGFSTDRFVVSPFQKTEPPAPADCRINQMRTSGLKVSPNWFESTGGGGQLTMSNDSSVACLLSSRQISFSFIDSSGHEVPSPRHVSAAVTVLMEPGGQQTPEFFYLPGSCTAAAAKSAGPCYSVDALKVELVGSRGSIRRPVDLRVQSGPSLVDYSL